MLIPWSGGLDSTLVLHHCLEWWYSPKDWNWNIYTLDDKYELTKKDMVPRVLSIECSQINSGQEKMQEKARTELTKYFNKKGWKFTAGKLKIDTSNVPNGISGSMPQPLLWLAQSALFIDDNEPLLVGWIKGDCATAHLRDLSELWDMLTSINGKKSKLLAPLYLHSKDDVITELEKKNILSKCWYCESPVKNKPCGECPSCLTMIGANAIVDEKRKISKRKSSRTIK